MISLNKNKLNEAGQAALRIGFSIAMIIVHGIGKLEMVVNGEFGFPDPLGIGAIASVYLIMLAEFICPIFTLVGFKTRYFSIPIIGALLVALLIFHASDPFADRELAFVYSIAFIVIGLNGSDRYSLDAWLANRKS